MALRWPAGEFMGLHDHGRFSCCFFAIHGMLIHSPEFGPTQVLHLPSVPICMPVGDRHRLFAPVPSLSIHTYAPPGVAPPSHEYIRRMCDDLFVSQFMMGER